MSIDFILPILSLAAYCIYRAYQPIYLPSVV